MGFLRDHFCFDHLSTIRDCDLNRQGHAKTDHHQNQQDCEKIGSAKGVMYAHYHINLFKQLT